MDLHGYSHLRAMTWRGFATSRMITRKAIGKMREKRKNATTRTTKKETTNKRRKTKVRRKVRRIVRLSKRIRRRVILRRSRRRIIIRRRCCHLKAIYRLAPALQGNSQGLVRSLKCLVRSFSGPCKVIFRAL